MILDIINITTKNNTNDVTKNDDTNITEMNVLLLAVLSLVVAWYSLLAFFLAISRYNLLLNFKGSTPSFKS